jgi:hypothetical protein
MYGVLLEKELQEDYTTVETSKCEGGKISDQSL